MLIELTLAEVKIQGPLRYENGKHAHLYDQKIPRHRYCPVCRTYSDSTQSLCQSVHPSFHHNAELINGKILFRITQGHSKCDKTEKGKRGLIERLNNRQNPSHRDKVAIDLCPILERSRKQKIVSHSYPCSPLL